MDAYKWWKRIRPSIIDYLKPGCGYGGSCFPKDVKAISALAKKVGIPPLILDSVINVNENQPNIIVDFLKEKAQGLANKNILVLGLAFRPDTDDVRESVSIKILKRLSKENCTLNVHDPISMENAKKVIDFEVSFIKDWKSNIEKNDIVIVATNWDEYLFIKEMDSSLKNKILFDTRSLFKPTDFKKINYININ